MGKAINMKFVSIVSTIQDKWTFQWIFFVENGSWSSELMDLDAWVEEAFHKSSRKLRWYNWSYEINCTILCTVTTGLCKHSITDLKIKIYLNHINQNRMQMSTSFHENLSPIRHVVRKQSPQKLIYFIQLEQLRLAIFFLIQSFECCGSGFITKTVPEILHK